MTGVQTCALPIYVVTARGPGLATEFASKLIEILAGRDALDEVRRGMLIED